MATKFLINNTINKLLVSRNISLSSQRMQSLWTPDNIVKSPHRDLEIPSRTVPENVWRNLERWADKTAIVCGITNRSYTYHQLHKYSRNFATKLRTQLKIKDDDVVCIMMNNIPEYAIAVLGALEAGAIVTTVNPIFTPREVQHCLQVSDPKVLIGLPETAQVLKDAQSFLKKNIPIITVKGASSSIPTGTVCFEEFAMADNIDHTILKEVSKNSEDVAFIIYSSGTTGLPKGVELTHTNMVVNNLQQDVETRRLFDETTKTNQDSTMAVVPFYHIYGLGIILLHKLSNGLKLVSVPKFHPNTFINVLKEHPINLFHAVPPLVQLIGSHDGVTKEHVKPFKTIVTGGASLPKTDLSNVLDKIRPDADFLCLFGMTEASPLVTCMLPGNKKYMTVGPAFPNTELRIVDSNLQSLGPNENGEVLIRGPQVMKGYRDNLEATKNTITEDGWLRSGDLGSIDEEGDLTITGRLKELIKVKGFQVPPAELENVLKEHPDILDVAVIGIPHTRMGEVPKAFVVLKGGRNVEADTIMSFVNERVAEYKKLKEVMILDAIPRNPSGKILREVLKKK